MDKVQWEKILQDPNELTRLAEWSRNAGSNRKNLASEMGILSNAFAVDHPPHLERLTAAVIAANNRSAVGAPLLHHVESFVPDLIGLTPIKALETLEAQFKADPSAQNGVLLQSAINSVTTTQVLDDHHLRAVDRASVLFVLRIRKIRHR